MQGPAPIVTERRDGMGTSGPVRDGWRSIMVGLDAERCLDTAEFLARNAARYGIDADVGMAREGLALLCQAAIGFVESLPDETAPKHPADPQLQIGNGAHR